MKWHKMAELWPMMQGEDYEAFKEGIRLSGGIADNPIKYRTVNGEKEGLDGRNRERACTELGLPIHSTEVKKTDEEVFQYILNCNKHRRHQTEPSLEQVARKMVEVGASTRAIAEANGVSQSTAARKARKVSQGDSPVKGRDGKTYTRTKKKPSKNGEPIPGTAEYKLRYAKLRQHVDAVARHYGVINTPAAEGVIRILSEHYNAFLKWHETLKKKGKQ